MKIDFLCDFTLMLMSIKKRTLRQNFVYNGFCCMDNKRIKETISFLSFFSFYLSAFNHASFNQHRKMLPAAPEKHFNIHQFAFFCVCRVIATRSSQCNKKYIYIYSKRYQFQYSQFDEDFY